MHRRLSRDNITAASRIMLPTYVALSGWQAFAYIVDPQGRSQKSPALALARHWMPMKWWGMFALAMTVVLIAAILLGSRMRVILCLYAYSMGALIWAGIYAGSLCLSDQASLVAPAYPVVVAIACFASARSLIRDEIS